MKVQEQSQSPWGAHHQPGGDNKGDPSPPPIPQTPCHVGDGARAAVPGWGAPGWEKELIPTPKSSLPASRL